MKYDGLFTLKLLITLLILALLHYYSRIQLRSATLANIKQPVPFL